MKKVLYILCLGVYIGSAQEIKKTAEVADLVNEISYQDKMNNKVFLDSGNYKMILFAMRKDQVLKPHSAPMSTPLLILEGKAKVTIGGQAYFLKKGEMITLPKDIDHGVYPISNVKFLLIK